MATAAGTKSRKTDKTSFEEVITSLQPHKSRSGDKMMPGRLQTYKYLRIGGDRAGDLAALGGAKQRFKNPKVQAEAAVRGPLMYISDLKIFGHQNDILEWANAAGQGAEIQTYFDRAYTVDRLAKGTPSFSQALLDQYNQEVKASHEYNEATDAAKGAKKESWLTDNVIAALVAAYEEMESQKGKPGIVTKKAKAKSAAGGAAEQGKGSLVSRYADLLAKDPTENAWFDTHNVDLTEALTEPIGQGGKIKLAKGTPASPTSKKAKENPALATYYHIPAARLFDSKNDGGQVQRLVAAARYLAGLGYTQLANVTEADVVQSVIPRVPKPRAARVVAVPTAGASTSASTSAAPTLASLLRS